MADLIINGQSFNTEVEGEATRPALVLSHSLGADLSMWEGQMPVLTKHFRVIRYDTRGHGGSDGGMTPTSIGQLGRDALAILDALEVGKVHWLGLSMGGAVGLWLLVNAPERIDRAVLANTAPRLGSPEGWNARITSVLGEGMADTAAATIERWFSPAFSARAPERVAAIHELLRKASPEGYAACCAALRDMDLRESLRGIEHDVLIVSGHDDPVIPADDLAAFVEGLSGARHLALEARHLSNIEAETAFNAAIIGFLTAKTVGSKPVTRRRAAAAAPAPRKAAARKVEPAKSTSTKRGSATRRSNAARNPLKKAPAKRAPAKRVPAKRVPAKQTKATAIPTPKKKAVAAGRRPVVKATAARRGTPKAVAKPRPAKAPSGPRQKAQQKRPQKTTATRRPTSTTTARSAVKVAVKKAKPSKTAAKVTKKASAKSPAKKLPAARRKPVTKPRRPTGRRKK